MNVGVYYLGFYCFWLLGLSALRDKLADPFYYAWLVPVKFIGKVLGDQRTMSRVCKIQPFFESMLDTFLPRNILQYILTIDLHKKILFFPLFAPFLHFFHLTLSHQDP